MTVGYRAKRILWKRDRARCFYCNAGLSWETKTVDHVIPKSKGGPHRLWNLVLACQECNQKKGDNDPHSIYLDIVLRRKVLHETMISVGQAIDLAKKQGNVKEIEKLLMLLWDLQERIRQPDQDFVFESAVPPTQHY